MQLNQPIPPSYPGGNNAYDFILNGNQKPKKTLLPNAKTKKGRLLLVVGGAVGIIFLLAIILSLVLGGGGGTQDLLAIAKTQTEIARVSNASTLKARDITTRNFVATVGITISSQQQQTVSYLASHKEKISPKTLALSVNPKTDAALKTAESAGRYDQELLTVLEKSLADYQVQLSQTYKATSSKSQKTLLQKFFEQVSALIKNQPAISS